MFYVAIMLKIGEQTKKIRITLSRRVIEKKRVIFKLCLKKSYYFLCFLPKLIYLKFFLFYLIYFVYIII